MRIYLDTTLQEIFESKLISGRTYNCLRLANLMTMEDLLKFGVSPSRFFGLKNFGSKCYAEILPLLREVKSHKSMKPVGPEEVFAAMGDTIGKMLEEAYETLCMENTDVAKYFKTCHPSVEALHMAVTDDVKHLLKIHSQLSMAENVEMRRLYVRYLEGALDRMRNGQQEQHETVEKYLATLTVHLSRDSRKLPLAKRSQTLAKHLSGTVREAVGHPSKKLSDAGGTAI